MKRTMCILTVVALVGLTAGVQAATTIPATQANATTTFIVPLSGVQEVPGPGDPDGTGTARLTFNPSAQTVDWTITVNNIALPTTGTHTHQAPADASGPVVIDFGNQLSGTSLFDADVTAILANPSNYYVNVHNAAFPDGAIRGQLSSSQITTSGVNPIPVPPGIALVAIGLASLRLARRKATA